MAILDLDGIVAGFKPAQRFWKQGGIMESPTATDICHSMFYGNGRPGAGVAPSSGLNGSALTSVSGQIPFTNPVSGNTYLGAFDCASSGVGRMVLCDRLWHNSGIVVTTTTAQSITFPTLPARDMNGSSNGEGVMIAIEVSVLTGNGAATSPTISYTNSAGTSGRTGTMVSNFPASAQPGTFATFMLEAGDTGVRSVQSITLGTSLVSGTIHLVAYRPVATIDVVLANGGNSKDALALGLPRLYDNTVPWLVWYHTTTSSANVSGSITYTQG